MRLTWCIEEMEGKKVGYQILLTYADRYIHIYIVHICDTECRLSHIHDNYETSRNVKIYQVYRKYTCRWRDDIVYIVRNSEMRESSWNMPKPGTYKANRTEQYTMYFRGNCFSKLFWSNGNNLRFSNKKPYGMRFMCLFFMMKIHIAAIRLYNWSIVTFRFEHQILECATCVLKWS